MPNYTEGFYSYSSEIYYGTYPLDQVSGWWLISALPTEKIHTLQPFTKETKAYRLFDNHAATTIELQLLSEGISTLCQIATSFTQATTDPNQEIIAAEQRLGISLPEELKIFYTATASYNALLSNKFLGDKERFLSLSELTVENEALIFYRIRRTPVAISLLTGQLLYYHKKQFYCESGTINPCCFLLGQSMLNLISTLPYCKKGIVHGKLKTSLNPKKLLNCLFSDLLFVMPSYSNYGNVLLYHPSKAAAWFRQNGFYADILLGYSDEALGNQILKAGNEICWK